MCKKYELLENDTIINEEGKKLYRIKALKQLNGYYDVDKGYRSVNVGDLGGYIERETNLSHEGNCWIYDKAQSFDEARVRDNAIMACNSKICNKATILNMAKAFDNALICDRSVVADMSLIFDNAIIKENVELLNYSCVFGNAKISGNTIVKDNAHVYGDLEISNGTIIGNVSIAYDDIFQIQCKYEVVTAIKKDGEILYSIGRHNNLTKEKFVDRIFNHKDGIEKNPYRTEYLKAIDTAQFYFSIGSKYENITCDDYVESNNLASFCRDERCGTCGAIIEQDSREATYCLYCGNTF